MNFKNQTSLFNPEEHKNKSITVVGAGSVGSFTITVLSKMGIKRILAYDDDTIEEHNMPNQLYKLKQLGKKKVDAIKEMVQDVSDAEVIPNPRVKDDSVLMSDVVITCTDSMSSRKLSYNLAKEMCRWLIDARVAGNTYRIYTVNLESQQETGNYEKTLYDDSNSDEGRCTEKMIVYNVAEVAGKIANQVKKVLNGETYSNFIAYDFKNDMLIKKRWE